MATKRPLALYNGRIAELADGDALPAGAVPGGGGGGVVLQVAAARSGAAVDTTAWFSMLAGTADMTAAEVGGTHLSALDVSITPQSADSILRLSVFLLYKLQSSAICMGAILTQSSPDKVVGILLSPYTYNLYACGTLAGALLVPAASTSQRTYAVRVGRYVSYSGGTIGINPVWGDGPLFGPSVVSSLMVEEIAQ